MPNAELPASAASLFSHVTAEKASFYRAIMDIFATAKRQFRLHLRPDEVLLEARWPGERPPLEEVQQGLTQLVEWGNLQAQPDTARVASIEDFYRKRLLYRLTSGGEAVEAGLRVFVSTLARRAELQSVALEDIRARLIALGELAREAPLDAARRSMPHCGTWCTCLKVWPRTPRRSWPGSPARSSCSVRTLPSS
jgi:uncharacterized protein (TIGR02677 family)